jgi:IclR family transcriptional regulator, pca regulon regulatory protein
MMVARPLAEDGVPPRAVPSGITRAAETLRVLSYHGELSAREVARYLEEDKSTIQRTMQALEQAGLVTRDAESELWSIDDDLLTLAREGLYHRLLVRRAEPFLSSLHARSKLRVRLAVPVGGRMVHIFRLPARADVVPPGHPVRRGVGWAIPMHSTALGHAYLAHLSPELRQTIYQQPDFGDTTPPLSRSLEDLEHDLARVLARGHAETAETFQAGSGSIAAPLLATNGRPVAAISVVATRQEIEGPRHQTLIRLVSGTASDITYLLSHPNYAVLEPR